MFTFIDITATEMPQLSEKLPFSSTRYFVFQTIFQTELG